MTSGWGWRRTRDGGRRSWISRGLAAPVAAAPWVTVGLMLLMLHLVSGTQTAAEGVLFDLPDSGLAEGASTKLVALALAMSNETLVFFDDARFVLGDGVSAAAFGECLSDRVGTSGEKTLLVLADHRVPAGDLMKLAAVARMSGVTRVLFANKRAEDRLE